MAIVPLNSIKFDAETIPLNSIKFDDEVMPLSAIKFDDDIDTPKKPSAFDNFLSSVGSGMAEESKNQLNLKTSKIKEVAKTVPFATIRGLEAITSPVTSALEPFGIQTRKMLQESAEYYRPDLGSAPNYTIDIDKNFKPSIKKLENAPVSEIVGGTAGGVGFILGPGALGMKAGELVTALPAIEKAARPFYRSILKGMIGGALTGEGKIDETLQNAAMFGIFEGLPYATKITKTIKDSTTWRRMTIKERGLVVQSLDDAIKANPKMTEGEILRRWNNPTWMEEAISKRATGEVPSGKIVPLNEIKFDTPTLASESSLETSSSVPLADAQKTPGQVPIAEAAKPKGKEAWEMTEVEASAESPETSGQALEVKSVAEDVKAEAPKGKEPWEMTKEEWVKEQGKRVSGQSVSKTEKLARNMHADHLKIWLREGKPISADAFNGYTPEQYPSLFAEVRKAVSEGKPVPPEVIAEYPDLAKEPDILQGEAEKPEGKGEVKEYNSDIPKEKYGIYTIQTKEGTKYAVRESMDNPRGFGDSIHNTSEDAKQYIEFEKARDKANEKSRIEREATAKKEADIEATKKAERENVSGFADNLNPMQKGKVLASLNKQLRFDGKVMTIKDKVKEMVAEGVETKTRQENVIKPMSRTQWNRADNKQQAAHEKKVRDAGKKTVYMVGNYDLGKTAYDYAKYLSEKPTTPTAPKPDKATSSVAPTSDFSEKTGEGKGEIGTETVEKEIEAVLSKVKATKGEIAVRSDFGFGEEQRTPTKANIIGDFSYIKSGDGYTVRHNASGLKVYDVGSAKEAKELTYRMSLMKEKWDGKSEQSKSFWDSAVETRDAFKERKPIAEAKPEGAKYSVGKETKGTGLKSLAEEQKKTEQKGEVGIDINQKAETTYSFSPEIEKPYQSSKGIRPEGIVQRIRNLSIEVGHKFSRDYEHLINKKENAQLIFDLKRLEKQKDIVADRTARINGEVLSGLNKQEYDLFGRKIFLDDLYEDFRSGLYAGKEMPFDFKPESLKAEKAKLDSVIANNPKIQEAIAKRTEAWKMVQGEYIEALKPYKLGVEEMFKDNYYRHQVLDYVDTNGIFGTGKKLKSPTNKGYTKGRKGVSNLYNTDFFEAEHQIMAQMLHDIETAKTLTKIQALEDISKEVRANAKEQKLKDWHKAIPEGYVTWQPKEGQVFYPVMSFNEKVAEKIMSGELEGLEDIASELKKVLAVGGKRKEWVVRGEVADTLNNLVREKSPGVLSGIDLEVMRAWKRWQLISPRRYFKYQARNMTGDAESTFIGNPSAFMKTGQAIKELYDVFYSKKPMSEKMAAWFERGGVSSTLQAQEMDSLKKTWMFQRLYEKKMTPELWKKYWNAARISTDFRESILRYANFLDYTGQLESGKLKNYGASKPEMIKALTDKYDKAFWLSNDLLGAYDRVSVAGQVIRERAIPFWSWQEVNFKRYIQLFRNAANDEKLASAIGKKLGARGVVMSLKIGKLAIKTTAFLSLLQVWNHAFFDDEEKELPVDIKTRSHIIVGKDSSGNILYFNRMGTLDDFISWFGLDYAPKFVNQLIQGKLSWKELLKEQATKTYQAPVNKLVQGAAPFTKLTAELISRKSTFPDVFKTGTVRDRWLHIARSIGLENEYIAMSGKPSRGYADSVKNLFLYKVSPGEAAYRNLFDMKDAFMKKTGRSSEGFWLTPTGDALYNMKLSLKYDDKEAFSKYLTEYVSLSRQQGKDNAQIKQGIKGSIQRMHPLSNMNEKIKIEFINSLNKDDQDTLLKAVEFYNEVLSGGN